MEQEISFRRNKLISKKCRKTCSNLKYVEHLLILASTGTGFVSIAAFISSVVFLYVLQALQLQEKFV